MPLSYYWSSEFAYVATTNVFNLIAFLSAVFLLFDPLVFLSHTGYSIYHDRKAVREPSPASEKRGSRGSHSRHESRALPEKTQWWKWYAVSATVHLMDAWFFRTIIPFYERAKAHRLSGLPPQPNDIEEFADICRLLWGIVRALSLFVILIELWEKRLVIKDILGKDYKNPKWGFAVSYFLAPAIVASSLVPVVIYFFILACRNSTGFFWNVIKDAFKPDWRTGQNVFVKTATTTSTKTVLKIKGATGTASTVAAAKRKWGVF
jgi:hypothetical protein